MPILKFQPKTLGDFLQRMVTRVVARTELTDLHEGSVLMTILAAVAREFDDTHFQMVNLQLLWDIETATGEDLDARGKDYNPDALSRNAAAKATGTVRFYRTETTANVTVPPGTVVEVNGGEKYATTALATLAIGSDSSNEVGVEALTAGEVGNVVAGLRITELGGPTGISGLAAPVPGVDEVNNVTPCTGGADTETDADFRIRIKSYLRSLSRATPHAIESEMLKISVAGYGRIMTVEVVEHPEPDLGKVTVYLDDGNGTIDLPQDDNLEANGNTAEPVISSAGGGEIRLYLDHKPLVPGSDAIVRWSSPTLGYVLVLDGNGNVLSDTRKTLTRGNPGDLATTYDFLLNAATGKITLNPGGPWIPVATASTPAGLLSGDSLDAQYLWYDGLLAEAQKVIEGDPNDRLNYPGVRAAGIDVQLKQPILLILSFKATIVIEEGFDIATVLTNCENAILAYVNTLGINGDCIATELIHAIQSQSGVHDVIFLEGDVPTNLTNTIVGEGELVRTSTDNIHLFGA